MSREPTNDMEARSRVTEMIKDARICMFTTTALDGRQVSRPMGLQSVEFDGDLWFFAYDDSPKIRQIRVNPEVNVSFSDRRQQSWVSVSGTAQEVLDRGRAEQLWNPVLKAWFPDGLDTPGLTLIKVHASSAEYWDSPSSSTVINLLGFAKAAVTGRPAAAGENREVSF